MRALVPVSKAANVNVVLSAAIVKSGLSQRDLSILTQVPEGRLSAIKRGSLQPTDAERGALAKHFGVDVAEMFGPDPMPGLRTLFASGLTPQERERLATEAIRVELERPLDQAGK